MSCYPQCLVCHPRCVVSSECVQHLHLEVDILSAVILRNCLSESLEFGVLIVPNEGSYQLAPQISNASDKQLLSYCGWKLGHIYVGLGFLVTL